MTRPARAASVLRLTSGILAVLLLAAAAPSALAAPAEDQEIRIGRQAATQIEARFKVVKDAEVTARVNHIGAAVSVVSDRPRLPYSFKVVEFDQVNAVALPGGFIYLTTGLLKFVRSDHELAAVIAHEVAHAARAHGMEMMRRANQAAFVTLLVAIFARDANLAQGAQIFSTGLLAGYARDLERDADLASITYLSKTAYSPVAVLTVLERLVRAEQLSPRPDPGAFAEHPRTAERAQYVEAELRARRIPLVRRVTANYLALTVRELVEGDVALIELLINNRPIVRLPDAARIREAADLLDRLFDADLEPFEVSAAEYPGGWGVFARGWAVFRFTPRDVPPEGGSVRDLAVTIAFRLRAAVDEDIRRRRLQG
ncbi:MAG: M48 family metalloprotease [bacterium]|nr:M48 family metalloprotease [bacterium]